MNNYLLINCFGLCSLYKILDNNNEALIEVKELKNYTMESCILKVIDLKNEGKLIMEEDYEIEPDEKKLKEDYKIFLSIIFK